MSWKYTPVIALFLSVACSTAPLEKHPPTDVSRLLPYLGLRADLAERYEVSEQAEAHNDGIQVKNFTARSPDGRVLRIGKFIGSAPEQAENFIKDKIYQFESIYEPHRDPYFAILTKDTNCPDRYRVVHTNKKSAEADLHILKLFANDRLTYGACTKEQAVYKAVVGMIRCPGDGSLFILESFVPSRLVTETDVKAIESMGCL